MHHMIPTALSRHHNVLERLVIKSGFRLYQMIVAVPPPTSKQHLFSENLYNGYRMDARLGMNFP